MLLALAGARAQAQVQPADVPHCGTFLTIGGPIDRHNHPFGISDELCTDRPAKQASLLSPAHHFRIHYDRTGPAAVSAADTNHNSVPDFVDAAAYWLDYAWEIETGELGFIAPGPDKRGDGPEIDVYICALPANLYGLTVPEPDNQLSTETVSAFLVLDNDYAGFPSSGYNGLRVTTAHEFNHVIQFMCYRYDALQSSLYEATAVWMERQVQPDIPDYLQYVRLFLASPHTAGLSTHDVRSPNSVTGYAHVLYLDYLQKKIATSIVREIWEAFAKELNCFTAIDNALRPHGLNLEDSYCEFAQWCYFTGKRARGDTFFLEARIYPTMASAAFRIFDGSDLVIGGRLYPLSFGYYRVALPPGTGGRRDTADLLVTNARTDFGLGGPSIPMDEFTLEVIANEREGYTALAYSGGTIYFKLRAPSPQFCVAPLFGQQPAYFLTTSIIPQPYLNGGGSSLLFGINLPREQVRSAHLWIYSSAMTPVREVEVRELSVVNNQIGVAWDGMDQRGDIAPSGVYIYELSVNDGEPVMGKFAVIQR